MIKKFFKIIIFLLSLIFIYFYGRGFINLFSKINFNSQYQRYFFVSFGASTIILYLFLRANSFIAILEHEFTHILWGLLFFKKPKGLMVNERGGEVLQTGSNFLITLAPYFSLTFSFIFLLLILIINREYYLWFYIILGILTGYHTSSKVKELHPKQTDIKKSGYIFSIAVIVLGNILSYGLLFSFILGGFDNMWLFLKKGMISLYTLLL